MRVLFTSSVIAALLQREELQERFKARVEEAGELPTGLLVVPSPWRSRKERRKMEREEAKRLKQENRK